MPDGRFLLYYKAMKPGKGEVRRMGVAIAGEVEGPYRFEKAPLTANEGTIEDGFAFRLNGEVCLLVTDCHGPGNGGGMIYHSQDGIRFDQESVRAYEAVDHYLKRWPNPAKGWAPWVLQRPALLFDEEGIPTHLFAPCGTPPEGMQGTATFLFEIKPASIQAVRLIWRDIGLDTNRGVLPGPFRYRVELETAKDQWTTILDRGESTEDFLVDYRECRPTTGTRARLIILGWPKGITPGVAEFTVFGKTVPAK
jgi:hypothetical protein